MDREHKIHLYALGKYREISVYKFYLLRMLKENFGRLKSFPLLEKGITDEVHKYFLEHQDKSMVSVDILAPLLIVTDDHPSDPEYKYKFRVGREFNYAVRCAISDIAEEDVGLKRKYNEIIKRCKEFHEEYIGKVDDLTVVG
jgi:hypothetical protein